jgi:hypothetical protein
MERAERKSTTAGDVKHSWSESSWRRRRENLLHKLCCLISARKSDGKLITDSFQKLARRFNGRALGTGHILELSEGSLRRHYYRWVKDRRPDVFEDHRTSVKKAIPICASTLRRMIREALRTGAGILMLYEKMGGRRAFSCSYASVLRRIPKELIRIARQQRSLDRIKVRFVSGCGVLIGRVKT